MKNRAPEGSLGRGSNSARDRLAYLLSIAATRCFKRANCPSTSMQSCAFAFSLPLSDTPGIRCYYGGQIVLKQTNVNISPASGRLGVLIPGMGAVTSTFIAGVEAVKQELGEPIGSLTQLATIRLGKRTEGRTPKIKDFVPLTPLECLSFGTWDIYEDNAYEAASRARVLDTALLERVKEPLAAIRPM